MKREAQFGLKFKSWLRANPMPSGGYELKQTTTSSLPFSAVKDHQINGLLACKTGQGITYKLPDDSISIKPFDYMHIANNYGWIVIKYPKGFVIIDVDNFILERDRSKRKSLTWEKAQDISWQTIKK
jgi:hypothetical protein